MDAKRRKTTQPSRQYEYGDLETALARVFGVADRAGQVGWFRGRIQNLRRLGLMTTEPGKGQKLDYGDEDVARLFFALLLLTLRVDPSLVVKLITDEWDRAIYRGEKTTLGDEIKKARHARDEDSVVLTIDFGHMSELPVITFGPIKDLWKVGFSLRGEDTRTLGRIVTLYDLSNGMKALHATLGDIKGERLVAKGEEEPAEPPARKVRT
jgi:hypothetical protein